MDLNKLPILVLDEILANLNSTALNNLRTTCRIFNSIVNQSKYLKMIKIYIKDEDQLEEIVKNSTWDIYSIVYAIESEFEDKRSIKSRRTNNIRYNIKRFIANFNSTLTQVNFKSFDGHFLQILSEANLQSLQISDEFYSDKILAKILKLNDLNTLKILKVKSGRANVQHLIEILLRKCSNLEYVRLPIWQSIWPAAENAEPNSADPLINFVKNRSNKLTIDFGGLGQTPDSMWSWIHDEGEETNETIFPITPTILLQFCQNSRSKNAAKPLKLRNVQHSSLPNMTDLTSDQKSNLDACIESIVMIEPDQSHSQKYFPPKAEIRLGIRWADELINFDPKLNITSIHWRFWGIFRVKNNPEDLEGMDPEVYKKLFRKDPKKLIQNYIAQGIPIFIHDSSVSFRLDECDCVKFPNLKKLYLFIRFGFLDYSPRRKEWICKGRTHEDILEFEF